MADNVRRTRFAFGAARACSAGRLAGWNFDAFRSAAGRVASTPPRATRALGTPAGATGAHRPNPHTSLKIAVSRGRDVARLDRREHRPRRSSGSCGPASLANERRVGREAPRRHPSTRRRRREGAARGGRDSPRRPRAALRSRTRGRGARAAHASRTTIENVSGQSEGTATACTVRMRSPELFRQVRDRRLRARPDRARRSRRTRDSGPLPLITIADPLAAEGARDLGEQEPTPLLGITVAEVADHERILAARETAAAPAVPRGAGRAGSRASSGAAAG